MNKKEILTLVLYNFWANQRILQMCERLSTREFIQEAILNPGWNSLRGILVHIVDAEYGWRSVLQDSDSDVLSIHAFADVGDLQARWSVEERQWLEYLDKLPEEALDKPVDTGRSKLKIWQTIIHVVNHGTQHRGEAASILTGYGQSPGEFDFDLFLSENPQYI